MSERCVLCNELFSRPKDKYLIQGRSKENSLFELESLPFTVDLSSSKHICRRCVNALKKRQSLILQVSEIENGLKANYPNASSTADAIDHRDSFANTSKRKRLNTEKEVPLLSASPSATTNSGTTSSANAFSQSTPKKDPSQSSTRSIRSSTVPIALSPILPSKKPEDTEVFITAKWPSKTAERKLPSDLESLGKMLLCGTYKQIAHAAWKNLSLKRELLLIVIKDIDKECSALCSKKNTKLPQKPNEGEAVRFFNGKTL